MKHRARVSRAQRAPRASDAASGVARQARPGRSHYPRSQRAPTQITNSRSWGLPVGAAGRATVVSRSAALPVMVADLKGASASPRAPRRTHWQP